MKASWGLREIPCEKQKLKREKEREGRKWGRGKGRKGHIGTKKKSQIVVTQQPTGAAKSRVAESRAPADSCSKLSAVSLQSIPDPGGET